jgi:hypothetical protein
MKEKVMKIAKEIYAERMREGMLLNKEEHGRNHEKKKGEVRDE